MSEIESGTLTKQPESSDEPAIEPRFNPTNAPESEVYARGRRLNPHFDIGWKPHSDFETSEEYVDIVRVMERELVESGLGLVASRIVLENSLGDFDKVELADHTASTHERRMSGEQSTPFISFASDVRHLVERIVLRHGYGLQEGQDGVIVHARVHPSRLLTPGAGDHPEVLLVGGVAPEEYVDTQNVADFVREHTAKDVLVDVEGVAMTPDEAIAYWKTHIPRKMSPTSSRRVHKSEATRYTQAPPDFVS